MRVFEFTPLEGTDGKVTAYLHSQLTEMKTYRTEYPVVVVCPGGGYTYCSLRENEPVAVEYFSKGYNVFVLEYSLNEKALNFTPIKELSKTIMEIRKNADEWNCKKDNIAICGFSAGAHLCYTMSTLWNNEEFLKVFDNEGGLNQPNAVIGAYGPVSCNASYSKKGGLDRVTGGDERMEDLLSPIKHVDENTPPTFIWQAVGDTVVNVENALYYMLELQSKDIYSEIHLFPQGHHGMAICKKETNSKDENTGAWMRLSVNFLNKLFDFEY